MLMGTNCQAIRRPRLTMAHKCHEDATKMLKIWLRPHTVG